MAVPFCKKANMLDRLPEVKPVLSLFSVSLSALFIIPMICNFATKPLLDKFSKNSLTHSNPKLLLRLITLNLHHYPLFIEIFL